MSNNMVDDINNKFTIINPTEAKKLGLCSEIITYRHYHSQ